MKYKPYSFSKINTFYQCPLKFKYIYIDKLGKNFTTEALLKGRAVHSILEKYPEEPKNKLSKKYKHIAEKFIKSKLGEKYLSEKNIKEFKFGLKIENNDLKSCSYYDKDVFLRGSVDFICVKDNVLHLIDWKTGKPKDECFQEFEQLIFYSLYFFQTYNIPKIVLSFVYIESIDDFGNGHENVLEITRDSFEIYKKKIINKIINIEKSDNFLPKISKLCKFCEFNENCKSLDK